MRLSKQFVLGTLVMIAMVACMIRDARAFDCLPATTFISGAGSEMRYVSTPTGECAGWWCQGPDLAWRMNRQCVLNKYRLGTSDPQAAIAAVLSASQPIAALTSMAASYAAQPAGAQEAYDYAVLWWQMCNALTAYPYPKPISAISFNNCGNGPTPPTTTPPAFVVAKNGASLTRPAFPVINGKRSFSSDGTVAVGSPCSDAVKFVEGSLTFLQVSSGHVAVCSPPTP